MIRCGQHGFTFDIETGEGLTCSSYRIRRYRVEQEGEGIFLLPAEQED